MSHQHRRQFLTDIGSGMFIATLGSGLAVDMGLSAKAADEPGRMTFGDLEPLVSMIQETPPEKIIDQSLKTLASGTSLDRLVSAAALANARVFGGEDYVGFHTLMALVPAMQIAREESDPKLKPLAVLKVLYRNANRLKEVDGAHHEVLHPVVASTDTHADGKALREAARKRDLAAANRIFASAAQGNASQALDELMLMVQDATDVHRTVLVSRSWELLDFVGIQRAQTMLRQSVHYCVKLESQQNYVNYHQEIRELLPKLLSSQKLDTEPARRSNQTSSWVSEFSRQLFQSTPSQAAEATAMALAEGMDPESVGKAISLFANELVLRDRGRTVAQPNKPIGSCHGDSIGVHACDSVNGWRVIARAGSWRTRASSLILAAYHVARDRSGRGLEFQNWQPYPTSEHREQVLQVPVEKLWQELDAAIRDKNQGRAAAITSRLETEKASPKKLLEAFRKFAISEDGALHSEKYYRTVTEESASVGSEHRWKYLTSLARVTASAYGYPAPGLEEAMKRLRA